MTGPVYPPPGGVSFSSSGTPRATGGATWTYQNFNSAAYGNLYWGPNNSNGIAFDGSINSPGETLTLSSLSGNTAVFSGVTTMNTAFGTQAVDTRLTLVATDLANNPINWSLGATLGIPTAVGIQVLGDYKLALTAEAKLATSSTYQSAQSLYDSAATSGSNLVTSIGGGFYYTEPAAPVPLPAAAVGGFVLIGGMGLRRASRAMRAA